MLAAAHQLGDDCASVDAGPNATRAGAVFLGFHNGPKAANGEEDDCGDPQCTSIMFHGTHPKYKTTDEKCQKNLAKLGGLPDDLGDLFDAIPIGDCLNRVSSHVPRTLLTSPEEFAPGPAGLDTCTGSDARRSGVVVLNFDKRPVTYNTKYTQSRKAHRAAVMAHELGPNSFDSPRHFPAGMWPELGAETLIVSGSATNRANAEGL